MSTQTNSRLPLINMNKKQKREANKKTTKFSDQNLINGTSDFGDSKPNNIKVFTLITQVVKEEIVLNEAEDVGLMEHNRCLISALGEAINDNEKVELINLAQT